MSKKKHRENAVTAEDTTTTNEPAVAAAATPQTAPITVAGEATPLLAEVQSFLSKRDELARKLAEEISATEAKLIELKRTAASLFPETAAAPAAAIKDKKLKKLPKAKPLPTKAEGATTTEAPAPSEEPNAVVSPSADESTMVD
ncbi:hypothetical protein NA78x_002669 [Anatilimnocola sp. NA78]|uniref:hypothetical protein n=1 Tax=Anatilimnocola sp. NA78 TaxID=3415683 RepID=UPI003CE4C082